MPIAMAEAILDGAPAAPDEWLHFAEGARRVLGVQPFRPTLGVGHHVLRRVAYDGAEILTDEGARIVAGRLGRR
jgi:hypothetical protein